MTTVKELETKLPDDKAIDKFKFLFDEDLDIIETMINLHDEKDFEVILFSLRNAINDIKDYSDIESFINKIDTLFGMLMNRVKIDARRKITGEYVY